MSNYNKLRNYKEEYVCPFCGEFLTTLHVGVMDVGFLSLTTGKVDLVTSFPNIDTLSCTYCGYETDDIEDFMWI